MQAATSAVPPGMGRDPPAHGDGYTYVSSHLSSRRCGPRTRGVQVAVGMGLSCRASLAMQLTRMPGAASHLRRRGGAQEHLAARTEAWVDFMADTGDGGNPTYAVARSLAAPQLPVRAPPTLSDRSDRLPADPVTGGIPPPPPPPLPGGGEISLDHGAPTDSLSCHKRCTPIIHVSSARSSSRQRVVCTARSSFAACSAAPTGADSAQQPSTSGA